MKPIPETTLTFTRPNGPKFRLSLLGDGQTRFVELEAESVDRAAEQLARKIGFPLELWTLAPKRGRKSAKAKVQPIAS